MNTMVEQDLQFLSDSAERKRRYPLWARAIADMIRLALYPVVVTYTIVQKIFEDMDRWPRFYIWISILAALMLFAGYSLLASLVLSMEILEFSIRIPWATLVSAYTWLVVAGSGLCMINALGAVFGMHRYEMITRRVVFLSFTSILFGLSYILFHMGRPERMPIGNIVSPNFRSAICWMGALYSIYLVFVVVELWLLIRADLLERAEASEGIIKTVFELITLKKLGDWGLDKLFKDPRLPRLVGTLAFLTGVSAVTMLGSLFAHAESRQLWYGPYYPVYFLVSALFCGYALLLAVTIITYRIRGDEMLPEVKALIFEMARVLAFLLVIGFLLTFYRLITGLFDPLGHKPVMLLLTGPFSPAFWIFEIGLMSIVPVFVLITAADKKHLGGVFSGSVMVLIGAFVMRYLFIVAGQIYPNIPEGLPSYWPTVMEIFIIVGIFGAFLLAYTLGERFLPLKEERLHHAG